MLLCPWEFSRQKYWSGLSCPPPSDLRNPGIELRPPALQADSLPAEPQRKPKNTRVGRLSLLQQIFPTQESNQDLLHCRWILYQPSHKGSPRIVEWVPYPFSSESSRPRNRTRISCIVDALPTELSGKPKLYWGNDILEDCLIIIPWLFPVTDLLHNFAVLGKVVGTWHG